MARRHRTDSAPDQGPGSWRCVFVTAVSPDGHSGYAQYSASCLAALRHCTADVDVLHLPGRLSLWRAAAHISRLRDYDLVVLNHYQMGRVLLLSRFARSLYISHNPEHLTDVSIAQLQTSKVRRAVAHGRAAVRRSIKNRILTRATLTTCICDEDAKDLAALGGVHAHVVPPVVAQPVHSMTKHVAVPLRVGLVGSFQWRPKRDNAAWFIKEIALPLAREGVAIRFVLAGDGASRVPRPAGAEDLDLVVINGFADPGDVYADIDVAVAPERQVGGIKLKSLEAASYGLPVIGSPEAFRGTRLPPSAIKVCATADDYRETIRELSRSPWPASRESRELKSALSGFTQTAANQALRAALEAIPGASTQQFTRGRLPPTGSGPTIGQNR